MTGRIWYANALGPPNLSILMALQVATLTSLLPDSAIYFIVAPNSAIVACDCCPTLHLLYKNAGKHATDMRK